jgi:hypothetical protein
MDDDGTYDLIIEAASTVIAQLLMQHEKLEPEIAVAQAGDRLAAELERLEDERDGKTAPESAA